MADALGFQISCGDEDAILGSVDTILSLKTDPIETIGGVYGVIALLEPPFAGLMRHRTVWPGHSIQVDIRDKIASKQLGQRNSGYSTCARDFRDRQAFGFSRSLPRIGVVRRNHVMIAIGEFMHDNHAWVARSSSFWFSDREILYNSFMCYRHVLLKFWLFDRH